MLDEAVTRRLALIKNMYRIAVQESQRPEPLCIISVLTFHDAIELFLELSCRTLDVDSENVSFMGYWDRLNAKLQEMKREGEVTQKASMQRLNKARVGLKHYGTMPSKLEIETFRSNVTSFFEENTPTIFKIGFASISLIDMVECNDAKNSLHEAEDLLARGKLTEALEKVAVAFRQVIGDHENRMRQKFGITPFFFGRHMAFPTSFSMGLDRSDRMAGFVDKVNVSIENLREAVRILGLGIDYRKYVRFQSLTPTVYLTDKGYLVSTSLHAFAQPSTEEPTVAKEDVQFCIDFTIESAITIQEFESGLER